MTTPADASFLDAVRRADVGRLSALLDARLCPPAVFERLVRHEDLRVRHLGWVLLTERVTSGRPADDRELAELAALLPESVDEPPESALVLAGLYERLGPYTGGRRRPSWRTAELPVRVRIGWLRAELLNEPTVIRQEPPGELLYQAVRETSVLGAHRPAQLVEELAAGGDPVLQAAALRLAREGLRAGLLAPAPVRAHAVGLLGADSEELVAAALRELSEPWATLDALPPGRLAPFLTARSVLARPRAGEAALVAAARHGHGGLLREVIADPELPPRLRRHGLELLGELAGRGDIPELTAVAARDPLLFGGSAVTCLRGLHRRGHFPDGSDVPSIIGLALADHSVPPREVATVLFTCRQAMFRVLTDAAPDAPDWPRRLALLVALAGQGAGELPIGEAITRLLPSVAAPVPFLDALRELRHEGAEDAVIALLPSEPTAALDALEAIGGQRTTRALQEGLGLTTQEKTEAIAPHLRAVRHRALELLWQLTHDPAQRHALLDRLDPADLPPRIVADLGGPDERELALLGAVADPDNPVAALCRLAAHGSAATLPVIADRLLRIVAELAASREPGGPAPRFESPWPTGEPVVPQEILNGVRALGRRLHERGSIRPSCLLDASNAREAGDAVVATVVLDLLDRPGLTGGHQAILLELLLRAPYARTRSRVHRLLRNRDRQVRKQVIALLARDVTGDDAQALSATLIALTAAQDIQTVRQALLALGVAQARWACAAVAACLDHPNMNVKKTAAEVLIRAGTSEAVPALLFWIGQHDNPGLRGTLVEALRAIVGDACAATLLAAAEHTEDARARRLLLAGLDRVLPARSVLALEEQGSPVAPVLLSLVADGRVGLASGTVEDLSAALSRHGITVPAAPRPGIDTAADPDVRSLVAEGWDPAVALRLAARPEFPHPDRLRELRPLLVDWLRLAGSEPAARGRVLRLTLRLCPAPWEAAELTAFARFLRVVLDGFADPSDEDQSNEGPSEGRNPLDRNPADGTPADGARHELMAVLDAVAPHLSAVEKLTAVHEVRVMRPAPTGDRSTLTLLRRLGAVLVRADLERALASAGLGADPWRAETAVLRDAFAVPPSPSGDVDAWRTALAGAVRTPEALSDFRRHDDGAPDSRGRLAALIDVYSTAGTAVRPALLDWMADLQPFDAPPWTITETAREPAPTPRTVHNSDLDQPRSTELRDRLLAMLESAAADRRDTAALALIGWPEPEAVLAVLRAFVRGRIAIPVGVELARALSAIGESELRSDDILHDRVARVALLIDPWALEPLVPLLLEWWEQGPPAVRPALRSVLRRVPADVLAERLGDRIDSGARGLLDLLSGRPLLRTPGLTRICRRLRAEGCDELADGLVLVDGPLRGPDEEPGDSADRAPADRAPAVPGGAAHRSSRAELFDLARNGAPDQTVRALTRLAEEYSGPPSHEGQDAELLDLLGELLKHPRPRVRLQALRTSRATLDRPTYLHHASVLLDDTQPDVVRTAVRTVCHATWTPAIPAVTRLLGHSHPVVREAATDGLIRIGAPAIRALRHAADHARPDRRSRFVEVLDRITAAEVR